MYSNDESNQIKDARSSGCKASEQLYLPPRTREKLPLALPLLLRILWFLLHATCWETERQEMAAQHPIGSRGAFG
ncbi:hypothetical protein TKK_0005115 [Trichogramma kaykai]